MSIWMGSQGVSTQAYTANRKKIFSIHLASVEQITPPSCQVNLGMN